MAKIPIMAIAMMGKLESLECNGVLKSEFSGLVIGAREPWWITRSMEEELLDLESYRDRVTCKLVCIS